MFLIHVQNFGCQASLCILKGLHVALHRHAPEIHRHLVLSALQQPLGNLILLYDVDMRTPPRQRVSIDSVKQSLGYRFKEVVWLLEISRAVRKALQAPEI